MTPADDQTADDQPLVSCVLAVDCSAVKGCATLAGLGFGGARDVAAKTVAVVHVTPATMTGTWNGKEWKLHPGF